MDYQIRDSFFNLVELSLLAKYYEQYCTPKRDRETLDKNSLNQTLLKMKATEKEGQLKVAIYHTDPVAFYWEYQGKVLANWSHPEHKSKLDPEWFHHQLGNS